ncbi:MAG: tRNA lysidine(34) synthetase TilS [Candidatus Eisenbacteria bacterium]
MATTRRVSASRRAGRRAALRTTNTTTIVRPVRSTGVAPCASPRAIRGRSTDLTGKIRAFVEREKLVEPGDSVLAAVSGGADSMALLSLLSNLRRDLGFRLSAAHFNHRLRGAAADKDALFVRKTCRRMEISLTVGRGNAMELARVERLSVEEAARGLRYEFLRKTAVDTGCNKVALGHTMEDQAETVLMRLIRGAGVLGLSAMRPVSQGLLIRPLLETERRELIAYLKAKRLSYRQDRSNLDRDFTRNKIRHELLAALRDEYNPRIVRSLSRHSALLGRVEDYLREEGLRAYAACSRAGATDNIELELPALLSYHSCVQQYVVREAYSRFRGSLEDLSFCHVESLLKLISSGHSGDSVDLPNGISAWLESSRLVVGSTAALRRARPTRVGPVRGRGTGLGFRVEFEPGDSVSLPEANLDIETTVLKLEDVAGEVHRTERARALFDLASLNPPLAFRNLEAGERIRPFGMRGTKKVQDLLVDSKVPRHKRGELAAFCDSDNLLWIVGVRRARFAPVTKRTRFVLALDARGATLASEDIRAGHRAVSPRRKPRDKNRSKQC